MIARIAVLLALAGAPQLAAQEAHAPAPEAAAAQAQHGAAPAQHGEAAPAAHGTTAAAQAEHAAEEGGVDFMHHISDAHEIELPGHNVWHLPPAGSWMVGPVDMTPTKHVVFMLLAATLVIVVVMMGASLARRAESGRTSGKRHNAIEALILFLRNEVVMKNIDHGEKFAPFIITLFLFILFCNLLGLLPWGATATSNISVTAALAIMTFIVIEGAGMAALGPAYLSTIFYWNKDLALPIRIVMFVIMSPVEFVGKITKPISLAIRLMANMTAGHIVLLAIISLIFVFGSFAVAVGPVLMAVAITFLELFVSFLQAYIFSLLAAVFIGVIRHAHH